MFKKLIKFVLNKAGWKISRKEIGEGLVFWAQDQRFMKSFEAIKLYTLVGIDRLFMIWQLASQAKKLPGDCAQVGVYKGDSARLAWEALRGANKSFYLFDTFSGMPEVDEKIDIHRKGDFADTTIAAVRKLFNGEGGVYFRAGVFPETAGPIENKKFCFAYIDADLYKSTKDCLEFFYPRMVGGGFMVFDDYQGKHTPGVKKAITEFLVDKPEIPIITAICQCLIIKQ